MAVDPMNRRAAVSIVAMAAVIVADLLCLREQFLERLVVNIDIVLVFVAFYLRVLAPPLTDGAATLGHG